MPDKFAKVAQSSTRTDFSKERFYRWAGFRFFNREVTVQD